MLNPWSNQVSKIILIACQFGQSQAVIETSDTTSEKETVKIVDPSSSLI